MNLTKNITAEMTTTQQSAMSKLDKAFLKIFGGNILKLEEVRIKPYSREDVRYIRSSKGKIILKEYREELVVARTNEISHYTQLEGVKRELIKQGEDTRGKGLKLSISLSKAKASCWTHILNNNRTGAMTSFERVKDKYSIMMELQEEEGDGVISIVDVEHQDQRTSRDYTGDKNTENTRRLGINIMDSIYYIENSMKLFCS